MTASNVRDRLLVGHHGSLPDPGYRKGHIHLGDRIGLDGNLDYEEGTGWTYHHVGVEVALWNSRQSQVPEEPSLEVPLACHLAGRA